MPKKRKDQTIYVPPVSPAGAVANTGGLMALTEAYRQMIAQGRLQKAQISGSFRTARADIAAALAQNLTDIEGGAIERGGLGSSTDLQSRLQARADAARALEEARGMKRGGLESLALGVQQAGTTLQSGLTQLEAQKAAEQAEIATQELQTGMTPGGGGGGAVGGPAPNQPGAGDLRNLDGVVARLEQQLANAAPGSDRARILQMQLDRVWKRRNQLRRRMGLKPVPVATNQGFGQRAM